MAAENSGIVLEPGGGKVFRYPRGGRIELKTRAADTGGAYNLVEFAIPPGGTGSPPHFHLAMEEGFYILEGELTFTVGGRTIRATDGSFILVPRGVVHTFQNTGAQPARCLIVISPADFEGYFEELSRLANETAGGQLDPTAVGRIATKYGQEFVEPPRHE